ncbi:MAG: DUF3048 domain-containing protein [Lachnospiraceae bacterium]|nr:DUF3048 domain-containing protein [Lachnospiraceae bacterium]
MIKKKYTKLVITTLALSMTLLVGCGKDKKDKASEDTTTEAVINIETEDTIANPSSLSVITKEGYVQSELTGEWIDESLENHRPICIMINNIIDAMPQSGISQADITYEMMVEGGITRYLCVFKDYSNIEKLGPVRSARPYYIRMAQNLGGIYTHYGWSNKAHEIIAHEYVANLNGVSGEGSIVFYRDTSRYEPHNVYTNTEMLNAGIDYMGYGRTYDGNYERTLYFNAEDTDLKGSSANKFTVAFSDYYTPWFEYDASSKTYKRFQYGEAQIDDQTGEQLAYKNVIIMTANYYDIGDGLYDIEWSDGGEGYFVSNGSYVPLTWKYENAKVRYYDEAGKPLKFNPGQSFVDVIPKSTGYVTFE